MLGLTEFRDVFVVDILTNSNPKLWKVSPSPVVVNCKWLNVMAVCYPVQSLLGNGDWTRRLGSSSTRIDDWIFVNQI